MVLLPTGQHTPAAAEHSISLLSKNTASCWITLKMRLVMGLPNRSDDQDDEGGGRTHSDPF